MWEKKIREPLNMTKVLLNMMLVLPNVTMESPNVTMEPLNVKKKNHHQMWQKNSLKTIQYDDGIVKCEKKNKETTKCDKNIVTCDVGIA